MVQEGGDRVSVKTNELKKHEKKKKKNKPWCSGRWQGEWVGSSTLERSAKLRPPSTQVATWVSERFVKRSNSRSEWNSLVEFCLNSKMIIIFWHMCTLTRRRASGPEAGRALSQCWRSSQPRSICFNIIMPAHEACGPEGPARWER